MEHLPFEITSEEYEFYGEHLILLEGAVEEFLSCLQPRIYPCKPSGI